MASPSSLSHIVDWDIEFNRPIVDGKLAHPITGEIQEAGRQGLKHGPPGIELRIFNINSTISLSCVTAPLAVSLEAVYVAVAKHVSDGIYKLISINASSYSFTLVCDVRVSAEDFDIARKNMFSKKSEYKYTDEEWDAYIEEEFGPRRARK